MVEDERLRRARACFQQRAWREAQELLAACDAESALQAVDLERLAASCFFLAQDAASDGAWIRAHRLYVQEGNRSGAVRSAFWLVFRLLNTGDLPSANGWIARLERLLFDAAEDAPERAQLTYLTGFRAVLSGDLATAETDLKRAVGVAQRYDDSDLSTLAQLALGRVLIFDGDASGGVRLLDEAVVAIKAGEVSSVVVADGCCTAIEACHDVFDVRRGQDWTATLASWCESQSDLVPYAGLCLVHRSEFLQLKGAWVEAMALAGLARTRLSSPVVQLALGAATYQQGELHRLRGEFDRAETCFRQASSQGRDPQPGLTLLRLAQGRLDSAAHGIGRALAEADPVGRPRLLAAYVEVMLAVGDQPAARAGCVEMADAARTLGSTILTAMSDRALGEVEMAAGNFTAALAPLRRARTAFLSIQAAYDVARTGILIARARRALGDEEGAGQAFEASRTILEGLGAAGDMAMLDRSMRDDGATADPLLTARELQVLRLVARGSTNRLIGTELGLSERTIDRHVSNIFVKLGVSSRAAATAFGYELDLL